MTSQKVMATRPPWPQPAAASSFTDASLADFFDVPGGTSVTTGCTSPRPQVVAPSTRQWVASKAEPQSVAGRMRLRAGLPPNSLSWCHCQRVRVRRSCRLEAPPPPVVLFSLRSRRCSKMVKRRLNDGGCINIVYGRVQSVDTRMGRSNRLQT